MLFIEGQRPRGVFVLCAGKAKLSTSSSDGKTIITKISEAGDVLGLNATISNRPYEVTAEMMEPGQFAKLLLSWSLNGGNATEPAHLKLTLTHEEIAEMIGTTRETVSRLFSDFRKKQLLQLKGTTLIIRNKPALEKMVKS